MVNSDSTVARPGDTITAQTASALIKLGITPVEIWLHTKAFYENGTIYTPDTLDIDQEEFIQSLESAHAKAFNLAYNAGYHTPLTTKTMLTNAHSKAINLAINAEILNQKTIENLLAKYGAKASALLEALKAKGYTSTPQKQEKKTEPEKKDEEKKQETETKEKKEAKPEQKEEEKTEKEKKE